jgi:hypothetical protein
MSKPETLKDIIEETMRVSGVPYKVPVREKSVNGGDHSPTSAWASSLGTL